MIRSKTGALFLAASLASTAPRVGASQAARQVEPPREIAAQVAKYESAYRDRRARIERLKAIYAGRGDEATVRDLETMEARLERRHANAMKGFRARLGEGDWNRLQREIARPSARPHESWKERGERLRQQPRPRPATKEQLEQQKRQHEERPKGGGR